MLTDQQVETITSLGNGTETDFVIGFTFQDNSHIQVTLIDESTSPYTRTVLEQGAGAAKFTVTKVVPEGEDPPLSDNPGTHVVMGTAPSATQRLAIRRAVPFTQTVHYDDTAAFPASAHEAELDRLVMMVQDVKEVASRSIQYKSYPVPTDEQLDAQAYIDLITSSTSSAQDSQDAAAASEAAAAASQAAANAAAASALAAQTAADASVAEAQGYADDAEASATAAAASAADAAASAADAAASAASVSAAGVPAGGTTGQVLAKSSNADYDDEWIDPPSGLPQPLSTSSSPEFAGLTLSGVTSGFVVSDGDGVLSTLGSVDANLVDQDSTHRFVSDADKTNWNAKEPAITTLPITKGGTGANLNITTGNMIYANGGSALQTLAIGSNGTFLKSDGSTPGWQSLAISDVSSLQGSLDAKVPYTGATSDLTLGSHNLSQTGYHDFVAIANPAAPAAGTARFHAATTNGFTRFEQDNEATTNLVLGRDNVFIVKNTSGSTINPGQPVYVTGSTGNVPTVSLARANSITTLPAVGVALDAITNNSFGQVMKTGTISSINTSSFTAGDSLWVSSASAGALVNTRPAYPNFVQRIGTVLVSGVGNGSILVVTAPFVGGQESGTGGNFTVGGSLTLGTALSIADGGTGQTTAQAAVDALVPTQTSNSGKFLTTNGTTVSWGTPAGSGDVSSNTSTSVDSEIALFSSTGGKTIKRATGTGTAYVTNGVLGIRPAPTVQRFTSGSSLTYTAPANVKYCIVTLLGGGGGGAGSGTGSSGGSGTAGGSTTFSTLTAGGGGRGPGSAAVGNIGTTSDVGGSPTVTGSGFTDIGSIVGARGGTSNTAAGGSGGMGAPGGLGGSGGAAGPAATGGISAAANSGAGGGGAGYPGSGGASGAGGSAGAVVRALWTSPANVTYTVGAKGTGGGLGSGGGNGGDGGEGVIIVEEFY